MATVSLKNVVQVDEQGLARRAELVEQLRQGRSVLERRDRRTG